MQKTLRFGFHDFLNAQPILQPLQRNAPEAGLKMILDVPSVLARELESGNLDLAMIPSIEYLRHHDSYKLLPGISIASRGPVDTVLFITKVPVVEIKTLALDERSRTSATLLRLLYGKDFSSEVVFRQSPPDPAQMLEDNDAALIIGDQALKLNVSDKTVTILDLSEEWFKRTGKTFVHAVIAIAPEVAIDQNIIDVIQKSKLEGLANLKEISIMQGEQLGLDAGVCKNYLSDKIRYNLDDEEMDGLLHFKELCCNEGLLPTL
ncbi:MAG: menaquinone biosynthesis protein [Nitrospinales bacterium]